MQRGQREALLDVTADRCWDSAVAARGVVSIADGVAAGVGRDRAARMPPPSGAVDRTTAASRGRDEYTQPAAPSVSSATKTSVKARKTAAPRQISKGGDSMQGLETIIHVRRAEIAWSARGCAEMAFKPYESGIRPRLRLAANGSSCSAGEGTTAIVARATRLT